MANFAAIFAIGYPVALDAKAEERDTLGLISMAMISSSSSGLTANCTLQPPAKSPIERIIWIAISRIFWYVLSESVMAGATVIESPVWIPIGSMFSMVQIITTLSLLSLSNSNSYSFQPIMALSIITSWMGDISSPRVKASSNSSSLYTIDAPAPPKVKDALIHRGNPNSWAISFPLRYEVAVSCGAIPTPISSIRLRNFSRSSVILIASIFTPMMSTSKSSHIPFSSASIHKFKAVCPPIVGKTASICGCSFKIFTMDLVLRGNR